MVARIVDVDFSAGMVVWPDGLGYRAKAPSGIHLHLNHLVQSRGELHGQLDVRMQGQSVHRGTFNVSSVSARRTTCSWLKERTQGFEGWGVVMEKFCWHVLAMEDDGPVEETVGDQARRERSPMAIFPVLPELVPTILFGPGGSMKSTVAAALGVSMQTGAQVIEGWQPIVPGNVLILDWESGSASWNDRIAAIAHGAGLEAPRIQYRRMGQKLVDAAEYVAAECTKHKISLLIIDSVGLAQGTSSDGSDANEATLRMFAALRLFGVTSLLVDHLSGDNLDQSRAGKARPYGCYAADTEVLTATGWKPHAEVTTADRVLGFDPESEMLRWEQPSAVWRYHHQGPMLHIASKATDALVTANHRLLLRPSWRSGRSRRAWQFTAADSVPAADWSVAVGGMPPIGEGDRRLTPRLREQCGDGARNKRLPEVVFSLSAAQQRILLEALIDGDGHRLRSGNAEYGTSSPQLADDVQRLALLSGLSATTREVCPGQFRVAIVERRMSMLRPDRNFTWEDYDGEVFCLTVPSGAYVTRRHGKTAIHGNSVYKWNLARAVFEVRKEASPDNPDARQVVLWNGKMNDDPELRPIGLRVVHGQNGILLLPCEITAPDLEQNVGTVADRIARTITGLPLGDAELAEMLDVTQATIRTTVARNRARFVRLPDRRVALVQQF